MAPCWTHLEIVGEALLREGGKFFIETTITLQIRELWPKIGFWQVSN